MKSLAALSLVTLSASFVAGCDKPDEAAKPVRPVLSVVAKAENQTRIGFAGRIEPRYRTDRAFQVLGRIVRREVDVGDRVARGQRIAENDPLSYQLALRSAEAELASAKSQFERTNAQQARTAILVERKIESQADLDADQQARDAAEASVRQAEAQVVKAKEQLRYTVLTSDIDGVVTTIDAEVGQMALPGMTVMTIARTDVREAVVDVPEDIARSLGVGAPFEIRLQADRLVVMNGKLREIAPEADASTRLRRLKITLDQSADPFRLGATITATPLVAVGPSTIEVPATALFDRDGAARVWIVDEAGGTVRSAPVAVIDRDASIARVGGGLEAGARVVTAGVNSLTEGQPVKIERQVGQ